MPLPQETLDAIIDAVATEDDGFATLHTLCLTGRAALPRCRRHLFRVIKFTSEDNFGKNFPYPRPNSSPLQALLSLLTYTANGSTLGAPIGAFVRILKITNSVNPLIIQITAHMPNLRSIIFRTECGERELGRSVKYEAFHEATRGNEAELDKCLKGSSYPQAVIRRIRELNTFLTPLPLAPLRLECLYVRHSRVAHPITNFSFLIRCLHLHRELKGYSLEPQVVAGRSLTVEKLEVYGDLGWLDSMLTWSHTRGAFENLRCLIIGPSSLKPDAFRTPLQLIQLSRHSLTSLEINLSDGNLAKEMQHDLPFHLPTLPNLKHLSLVSWPRTRGQPMFGFPSKIIALLSAYGTTSSALEAVQISLTWKKWDFEADWDEDGSWQLAKRTILGSDESPSPGFRHLRSFKISVHSRKGKPVTDPAEKQRALEKLRSLFDLTDSGIEGGVVCNLVKP
ncbi:hypothetical protein NMY22_g5083 [Coprinellus aureogranulatus]|nr:hypothetical protein NMY22_g5083 [Coprinellus aureogranulatus]